MAGDIKTYLDESRRIVVVGVSRSNYKYGTIVYHRMKERGYEMVPVNPSIDTFDGQTCYPNLSAIPEAVDSVVVVVPPYKVPDVLREAAELDIKHVWLQPGAESAAAAETGEELDLNLVSHACVMVVAPDVA